MNGYISEDAGGISCVGDYGVAVFRLVALRGALKLESHGLKSRGGALRPRLAAEFGLRPRASYEVFIEAIETRLEEMKRAQLAAIEEEDRIATSGRREYDHQFGEA